MSKPKILSMLDNLDKAGYYNNPVLLGDVRTTPTCLDGAKTNGIYVFTGGDTAPADSIGSYVWSLRVYTSQDCSCLVQEAEKLNGIDSERLVYIRKYIDSEWTSFARDIVTSFSQLTITGTPTSDTDAVNKNYVDTALANAGGSGGGSSGGESISTPYAIGTTAPDNTKLLWIDTTASTGGLKYYDGSAWVHVPVAYT